ncbi:MAG: S41 family peptidase, partial [bacterium]|nr:S41 family peptidase [bacterium]
TVDEFDKAFSELEKEGMKALLLDLRGNSGGLLDQAFKLADRFVDGRKKIVFTKGRIPESNSEFYASSFVTKARLPLVILIDKGSASASEIVAGAVQDWDRGLIVGETSFGKGLVQTQISLKDGSALRITTARYYTPSGRLIQRSYEEGLLEYYASAYNDDDQVEGEQDSEDSEKPVFFTDAGRKVYGGGGISPDVHIKHQTISRFSANLIFKRLFFEFASKYCARHPELKGDFNGFKQNFQADKAILVEFRQFVESSDMEFKEQDFKKDLEYIKLMIKSEIARNLWGSSEYYHIRIINDHQVQEALKSFDRAAQIAGITFAGS